MSLLTLSNVNIQYGNRLILEGASLSVQPQVRMGLVGRNGSGKSSLLNIMAGVQPPDSGTVDVRRGTRVGLLDQHPKFPAGMSVREVACTALAEVEAVEQALEQLYASMAAAEGAALQALMTKQSELESRLASLGGWSADHQVDATLHGLGFRVEMLDRPADVLSGGERARLALAKLLLEGPDLLLLDEPTNHLDLDGRRWLATWLAEDYSGAVMIVSHDRWLLDRVCTQMVDIRRANLELYNGNYTTFRSLRAERLETESRAWQKQQDLVRREQDYIRRYKAGQRAKQARGRESRLQRMIDESTLEQPEREAVAAMHLPPIRRCGDRVVSAEQIQVQAGDKLLVEDLSLEITRGDRIGIVGPNGAGKTTLVRCLLGDLPVQQGGIVQGAGVEAGWFRQTQGHLRDELAVWEYLQGVIKEAHGDASEQQARDLAGSFLFTSSDQDRLLGTMSGGERARAMIAGLFGCGCNVLVLDEPTNHIDLDTTQRLESVLADGGPFDGTLILVSHDRAMLEATCHRLVVLDGQGGAVVSHEPVDWVLDKRWGGSPMPKSSEVPVASPKAPPRKKKSKIERLSSEELERQLAEVESAMDTITEEMGQEEVWSDASALAECTARQKALQEQRTALEDEWMRRIDASS